MIEKTAGRATAEYINDKYKYDYLMSMQNEVIDQWIALSGFSKEECAMIQPTYVYIEPPALYTKGPVSVTIFRDPKLVVKIDSQARVIQQMHSTIDSSYTIIVQQKTVLDSLKTATESKAKQFIAQGIEADNREERLYRWIILLSVLLTLSLSFAVYQRYRRDG